jgi:UDP-4-amino-4,6-dideoxy-N-acetyl-beta-L-altrosamine transaminase
MNRPKSPIIPYARQSIDESDIAAVVEVLRSEWLTQGPAIERFERLVADYCGAQHALAVSSATAALHLSCLALGLKPGDWLWTSPNTFVASANCALYCGAAVDFVDIDPRTYNLSIPHLTQKLSQAEKLGRLPKVVVPVHFAGQSCEMEAIAALARRYGFKVIEDAAHATGARYQDRPVGNCRFSDLAVFSFHPVKIITTGEGGMIMTNDAELQEKLLRLRSHGITRDPKWRQGESHGPWYYQQIDLGYHYRTTDIQAALGASQMKRLDQFLSRRRTLARRYEELLRDLPLLLPWQHPDTESSWHLYVVRLQLDRIRKTHRQAFEELRAAGLGVNLHYIPVHTQPYYQRLGFRAGDFPEVERYYAEAITLPLFYELTEADQEQVVRTLRAVL